MLGKIAILASQLACVRRCSRTAPVAAWAMRGAPLAPADLQAANVQLPWLKNQQLVVSATALRGWVEQTSPACAAASVAGAIQGLLDTQEGYGSVDRRLNQADALQASLLSCLAHTKLAEWLKGNKHACICLLQVYRSQLCLDRSSFGALQVYVSAADRELRGAERKLSKTLGLSGVEPLEALEDQLLNEEFKTALHSRPDVAALAAALQRMVTGVPVAKLATHIEGSPPLRKVAPTLKE